MILYDQPYVVIKGKSFLSRNIYILQIAPPYLIGVIQKFHNNPKGEAQRCEYLASANLDLTGKANQHRVFCHPYGSCEKLGNQIYPEEIRQIMTEMADFFVCEIGKERSEELRDTKNV